jgi:hypothetical protein
VIGRTCWLNQFEPIGRASCRCPMPSFADRVNDLRTLFNNGKTEARPARLDMVVNDASTMRMAGPEWLIDGC